MLIFNTIGKRLFLVFSILVVNVFVISILSYQFNHKSREIFSVVQRIQNKHIQISNLLRLDVDFLRFESSEKTFHATGKSAIIQKRDSLLTVIKHETLVLKSDMRKFDFEVLPFVDSIEQYLSTYNNYFNNLKSLTSKRGFKDYGLEGKMRQFAHELENHKDVISSSDILMLRRHEKDFFLRKEKQYIQLFNKKADHFLSILAQGEQKNSFIIFLLKSYKDYFNQLTQVETEIGLIPSQGLYGKLNLQANKISWQIEKIVQHSEIQAEAIIKKSLLVNILIGLTMMAISFAFTYVTTIRLTRPIKKLSLFMSKYVLNKGLNEGDLADNSVTDEIKNLSATFITLTKKLNGQFDETRQKSSLLEKRNKELQKLNDELDRFIYSSAHDLKSPLASLDGLVNLARKEINSAEHDHYFERMKKSIERMNGFIRDITDYAKNKRQQLRVEKIDLKGLVDDIIQSMRYLPEMERITIHLSIEINDFFSDRTRLEIILKNIISNAIRYSDVHKVTPYVLVYAQMEKDLVTLVIKDNGIGIGQEHLDRIFEMFYRAVDTAKGSGIGLFLVRESVKILRGKIQVESILGEGTIFTLKVPNLMVVNVNQLPETEPLSVLAFSH